MLSLCRHRCLPQWRRLALTTQPAAHHSATGIICNPRLPVAANFSSSPSPAPLREEVQGRGGGERSSGRGAGWGGRSQSNPNYSFGHTYKQVGGPLNPKICTLSEQEIHALIRKRVRRRRAQDFQKADDILRTLNEKGVQLDDASKEWWADGRRMIDCHDKVNKYGHGYTKVGGKIDESTCELSEEEIHNLIQKRSACRRARDFGRADEVRERLNECGVQISDERMQWWLVGARIRDRKAILKEHGHNYKQAGGPINKATCKLSEEEIHGLIKERMKCRHEKQFDEADDLLKELDRAGVYLDDDAKQWRADGRPFAKTENAPQSPKMKDFQSLEEAIEATHANLTKLTPRDLSAFMMVVPQFLQINRHAPRLVDRKAQLGAILAKTLEGLDSFRPRELSTAALGLARIVNAIGSDGKGPGDSSNQILRDLLVGEESKNMLTIFRHIARASMAVLDEFDERCLSNLADAYDIVDYDPVLKDGSTLQDRIAERSRS